MTTRICQRCGGHGDICAACGENHKRRHSRYRVCRARRSVPCPGVVTPGLTRGGEPLEVGPHFETFTECDVCRVRKPGSFFAEGARNYDTHGWQHIKRSELNLTEASLQVCLDCARAHEKIRTMTLEYLMGERGGLRMGEVLDLKTRQVAQPALKLGA